MVQVRGRYDAAGVLTFHDDAGVDILDIQPDAEVDIKAANKFKIAGVAVAATAAELNTVAGVTAGTVTASKVLVVDASKDLATLHKLTFSQEVVHGAAASQTKSANYTMTAADSGYVTYIDTDAFTVTLPATVVGMAFTFVNAGADGAVAVTIRPGAVDKIQGVGLTAADNKALINTKATAKKGDMVRLVGDGVDGWFVQALHGTWAREA